MTVARFLRKARCVSCFFENRRSSTSPTNFEPCRRKSQSLHYQGVQLPSEFLPYRSTCESRLAESSSSAADSPDALISIHSANCSGLSSKCFSTTIESSSDSTRTGASPSRPSQYPSWVGREAHAESHLTLGKNGSNAKAVRTSILARVPVLRSFLVARLLSRPNCLAAAHANHSRVRLVRWVKTDFASQLCSQHKRQPFTHLSPCLADLRGQPEARLYPKHKLKGSPCAVSCWH